MDNKVILNLGGQCQIAEVVRKHYNILQKSLPFDYLRISLPGVIKYINNNFENYIPHRERSDYIIGKIKLFIENDRAFYNHNITLDTIKDSFKRRCERFNEIIIQTNEIILVRVITSKNLSNELNLKEELYNTIKNKNKMVNLKIIFIGHRNDDDFSNIYYEKLNDYSSLFVGGYKFRLEDNYQIFYKSCIDFILKNGFLNDKIKININTLDYEIENDLKYNDVNFYYLDNYFDIIPKKLIKNELIICREEFYSLYPDFDINIFKKYNDEFKLFNDTEIINYFYIYGKESNMVYSNKTLKNY